LKFFYFALLFFLWAASLQAADFQKVGHSVYWKLLLHWQRPIIGSEKSEADGMNFFLSPQGKTDAVSELTADVEAFRDFNHVGVGPLKQHPQCAFPERFRFLNQELQLQIKSMPCPTFTKWKDGFNPQSVTLVYAAPYFGSPASMFGHTFLRIDSKPRPNHLEKNDLLDYGISYEASTGPNPGLAFAVKGLLGFYPGMFIQQPYYLKINNYVNMESRDLWEYTLEHSPEQIDRMLNHIWEMGITYFNYYFFNKNCSYEILSLLEVANPNWSLRSHFTGMTIPSDTIRILAQESHSIRSVHLRPALLRVINYRLNAMSDKERKSFFDLRNDFSKLTGQESIKTLDALLDWDKLKVMKELKAIYDPEHNVDKRLLVARARAYIREKSELETTTDEVSSTTVAPEKGHESSKFSLFGGIENTYSLFGFEYRPVFQDLLDPDEGYLPHSSLIIAKLRGSLIANRLRLDDFTLAEVLNLVSLERVQPKFSWRIGGGLFHPEDIGCVDCIAGRFSGGEGLGFTLLSNPDVFFYSLLEEHAQISNEFQANYNSIFRLGFSLESGILTRFGHRSKLLVTYEPYYFSSFTGPSLQQYEKLSSELSYAFLPFEARVSGEFIFSGIQSYSRVLLTVARYF
jgi:hypothetical protein